ncbi:2-hydroxy-acid oxidase, partial [Burkholderia multivorans]
MPSSPVRVAILLKRLPMRMSSPVRGRDAARLRWNAIIAARGDGRSRRSSVEWAETASKRDPFFGRSAAANPVGATCARRRPPAAAHDAGTRPRAAQTKETFVNHPAPPAADRPK